jgi:sugar/nucleoside kinase (ribokinase family)
VTDFGHGLISDETIERLHDHSKFLAVNAQTNSSNYGFNLVTKYKWADYVAVNANEARLAVGRENAATSDLSKSMKLNRYAVTRGKDGVNVFDGNDRWIVPALIGDVQNMIGAGDTFFAISAPFAKAAERMEDVGFLGNLAGAMKVGSLGNRKALDKISFLKFMTALLK